MTVLQLTFAIFGLPGSVPVILIFMLLEKLKLLKHFSSPYSVIASYFLISCLAGLAIIGLLVLATFLLWPLIGLHALWATIACYGVLTTIGYFVNNGAFI
jgi:hypothetical protein